MINFELNFISNTIDDYTLLILAKRLSEEEKILIVKGFTEGKTIVELAHQFFCTKSTITRNLKRNLGEKKYEELTKNSKFPSNSNFYKEKNKSFRNKKNMDKEIKVDSSNPQNIEEEFISITPFTEIAPLNCEIENSTRKDLSSVLISEVDFPKIVYMIVDKKIELEIKYLKEYPEWQFLSDEELNRKTIEIFVDMKIAKRFCNKEQKVIKVPNTDVFKIVAPFLIKKGISRIVSSEKLIAL